MINVRRIAPILLLAVAGACQPGQPAVLDPPLTEQADMIRQGRDDLLRLDQTPASDADLEPLADLGSKVRRINFSKSLLTDAGLERLCQFDRLEMLRIESDQITDVGLASLAGLDQLDHLHLLCPKLTDAAVDHLAKLQGLESLYLDRTQLTPEGIGRLAAALPGVHMHIDGDHAHGEAHTVEP